MNCQCWAPSLAPTKLVRGRRAAAAASPLCGLPASRRGGGTGGALTSGRQLLNLHCMCSSINIEALVGEM